jgi:serine/threonine protein kinase/Flp pilus assembly protein TadD
MIGQTISHYKILEKIGEGGMGVVYKAEDTKLERTVVLKFLPAPITRSEEDKIRFRHEAKAAAKLHHPNICTIHEIDEADGQFFIVMAYIEGVTLQDKIETSPLRISEALNYLIQVAEGLSVAHKSGVVHRDIKSSNIMITPEGRAIIMDFGLAHSADMTRITTDGMRMGTIAYMSPEQARGEIVDYRSDIWSLGVVFYESLTGTLPFKGDNYLSVMYKILNDEPKPIDACLQGSPAGLDEILKKTLVKNLENRFKTIDEMLSALRMLKAQLTSGVTKTYSDTIILKKNLISNKKKIMFAAAIVLILSIPAIWMFVINKTSKPVKVPNYDRSIAVLPFVDMSPEKDQEYFCDGISEEIINALSKLKNVRVIARTSAFSFKGKTVDVREIGRILNVKTLLEGSVRKAGKQLRITSQLINTSDGSHLWSETYDRKQTDIFAVQEDIAKNIVDKLKIQIMDSSGKPLVSIGTDNLEAYHYYLKGMHLTFYSQDSLRDSMNQIIKSFRRAIELDPNYAEAHAQLASRLVGAFMLKIVGPEALTEAKEEAIRAVQLNDTLPAAYEALGRTGIIDGTWEDSEKYCRKAIELDPSYAPGYLTLARGLEFVLRYKEASVYWEKALELDPLNRIIVDSVFWSRVANYDWAGAEELIKDAERIGFKSDEQFVYFDYPYLMLLTGRIKEAESKVWEGLKLYPRSIRILRFYAFLLYRTGRYDEALKQYNAALKTDPNNENLMNNIGQIYLIKSLNEDALKIFQKTGNEYWENITLGRMGKKDILRSYAAELEKKVNIIVTEKKLALDRNLTAYNISCLYAELGDKEKMFQWLDKAYNIGDPSLGSTLSIDYLFTPYRNEPRFKTLLKKMNLKS